MIVYPVRQVGSGTIHLVNVDTATEAASSWFLRDYIAFATSVTALCGVRLDPGAVWMRTARKQCRSCQRIGRDVEIRFNAPWAD